MTDALRALLQNPSSLAPLPSDGAQLTDEQSSVPLFRACASEAGNSASEDVLTGRAEPGQVNPRALSSEEFDAVVDEAIAALSATLAYLHDPVRFNEALDNYSTVVSRGQSETTVATHHAGASVISESLGN